MQYKNVKAIKTKTIFSILTKLSIKRNQITNILREQMCELSHEMANAVRLGKLGNFQNLQKSFSQRQMLNRHSETKVLIFVEEKSKNISFKTCYTKTCCTSFREFVYIILIKIKAQQSQDNCGVFQKYIQRCKRSEIATKTSCNSSFSRNISNGLFRICDLMKANFFPK